MRNFLIAVALSATFALVSNAMAQKVDSFFWGENFSDTSVSRPFGVLGIGDNANVSLNGGNEQTIGTLYLAGKPASVASTGEITKNVENFFVTPDTVESGNVFTGPGSITNFTLYVGPQIAISDATGGTNTGNFGTDTADNVTMSATEVNGVSDSFGSWGITNRTVQNEGTIGQLTYSGGTYVGNDGTIGNLIVGTDLPAVNNGMWGTVEKLGFVEGGSVISKGAYANGTLSGALDFMSTGEVTLANGSVNLDMNNITTFAKFADWVYGLGTGFTFDVAAAFDGLTVNPDMTNFGAADFAFWWSDGEYYLLSDLMGDAELGDNKVWEGAWGFENGQGSFTKENAGTVPEPATLAVLGLGLAGLGLVSRRRRK